MNIDELLSHFDNPRKNGQGWMARCPAHDDRRPSLSISLTEDGSAILLHCHAGCRTEDVLAASGLSWKDLFLDGSNSRRSKRLPPQADTLPTDRQQRNEADPMQWLADYCGVPKNLLHTLPLSIDDGAIAFGFGNLTVRKLRLAGTKSFRWQPEGAANPPLWPLPDGCLPEAIVLNEGETDAIIACHLGLDAYALTKGAETPLTLEQALALKQRGVRRVVLCLDADRAGRDGATKQAATLQEAGLEAIIVDLAGAGLVDPLCGTKDLRDAWLALRDREALRQRLEASASGSAQGNLSAHDIDGPCADRLPEMDATELMNAEIPAEPDSLPLLGVKGYFLKGWSHILAGYPKGGKTELTFACVRGWLAEGVSVLWFSEEGQAVWQQRLARYPDFSPGLRIVFAIGADPKDLLERARSGSEDVVIVDTVRNLLRLTDENDNAEVVRTLGPWEAALQGRTRIYLHHERKMGGEHGQAIAGGGAFLGVVDRAIELKFDPHEKKRRQLVVHSRIVEAPDLLYELTDDGLRALGEPGAIAIAQVEARILEVLTDEWLKTKEVLELLDDEPRPSLRQVQEALKNLHQAGKVERDPGEDRPRATYRWRLAVMERESVNCARTPIYGAQTDSESAPNRPCPNCGGTDYWQRSGGGWLCKKCHPPAFPPTWSN